MRKKDEIEYFKLLQRKIVNMMQHSYPGIPEDIREWKGQDIIEFQEELHTHVSGNLSEKWFYLHMKSDRDKLPRIDTLNLLSRFTGYVDWNDFIYHNKGGEKQRVHPDETNQLFYMLPVLLLIFAGAVFMAIKLGTYREYQFCFVNQLTKKPVTDTRIEIILLWDNKLPEQIKCDSTGCFIIRTNKPEISFLVNAPYYHKDTIDFRLDRSDRVRTIGLHANDYAMMIHYLTNANIDDWQVRRDQLDMIFSDNAMIYQVYLDENLGMEVYNKWEFINKITLPAEGLKNLEIIETVFSGEEITKLWFRQMDMTDD